MKTRWRLRGESPYRSRSGWSTGAVAVQTSRTITWMELATGMASSAATKPPRVPPIQLPIEAATKMDTSTSNGGVSMSVPANYSARLETGTVNGHIRVDFPVTVSGQIDRQLSINLGSGGPLVRAPTTNGGVSIKRKET